MFGKGKTRMSENDKFIMAAGRKAGNLKPPMKKDTVKQTSATVNKAGLRGREQLGTIKVRP